MVALAWEAVAWAFAQQPALRALLDELPATTAFANAPADDTPELPAQCVSGRTRLLAARLAREHVIAPARAALADGATPDVPALIAAAAARALAAEPPPLPFSTASAGACDLNQRSNASSLQ